MRAPRLGGRTVRSTKDMRRLLAHAVGRFSAYRRLLPEFVVIGARKSGSTSLYEYLAAHPRVLPGLKKEPYYFDLHYQRGIQWYRAHFPLPRDAAEGPCLTGEATPGYLFDPVVAERVRADLPGVKLLVVLRNPIDRAFSEFRHVLGRGNASGTFAEAVDAELAWLEDHGGAGPASFDRTRQAHLWKSLYADRLAPWLTLFPREQRLVLQSEPFFADPAGAMQPVFDFMGLSRVVLPHYKHYIPGSPAEMEPGLRARLTAFFAPHNAHLAAQLGQPFTWE